MHFSAWIALFIPGLRSYKVNELPCESDTSIRNHFYMNLFMTKIGLREISRKLADRRYFERTRRSGGGGAALGTGMVLIPQIMTPQGQTQVPSAVLVVCPKCRAHVPATSKFCPECGTSLRPPPAAIIKCFKCGSLIPSSSKFCPECGIQMSMMI